MSTSAKRSPHLEVEEDSEEEASREVAPLPKRREAEEVDPCVHESMYSRDAPHPLMFCPCAKVRHR